MPSLIDSASAVLLSAERRLEASAQNVANASTKGYKKQVSFSETLSGVDANAFLTPERRNIVDFTQGRLTETGNPLDLAIFGPGLVQVRDGDHLVFSRGGSFVRGEDGLLADATGRVLQQAGGGDIVAKGAALTILEDGTLLEDGAPTARLGLYEPNDLSALTALGGSAFAADPGAMGDAAGSQLRAGFIENSNVTMSDEMLAMMSSVRQAESGARLVQFYDELIGQAITTFSRSGK
ncbi:MAG: flagellar hook basal-body protein [Candidatus Andeanibacterium colombiense]|uniref:Flagellar hook basal-body protein n=1 Tax=Candidatus Andeanibacterium colombiense TaxID=3121345 RepID=A0AAJ6BML5_9SPHN|nr:MAG: flagellar hook basal-body protein [Sphingomonadaceae bacterium]